MWWTIKASITISSYTYLRCWLANHGVPVAEQGLVRLLGMEVFLSSISYRQDSSLRDLLCFKWQNQRKSSHKTPEERLKGPEKLIKIRRPHHLRPCTHPNLVSNFTLLKFCRRKKYYYCLDSYHILLPDYITSPLLSKEWMGIVLEVLAYCVPLLPGKVIKPLFPSPP